MLPKSARLTTPSDFARATKSGFRSSTQLFVGYLFLQPNTNPSGSKVGFIIGKSVGGSVQRHSLARKLRHLLAPEISNLPRSSLLVFRALTGAGKADKNQIALEVANIIKDLNRKAEKLKSKEISL